MQSYIKLSWKIWLFSNYNMIWIRDDFLFQGPTPGADEMVGLLVNAGMYDKALTICQLFGMKLTSVFDSLALRYVLFLCFFFSTVQCNKIIQHLCSANYQTVEKTLFYHFIYMQAHIKEVRMLKLQFYFVLGYFPVSTNLKDFLPARVDSSDERDVLQIETEEFQDSDNSEIGYWSEGGEREPCESELFVVERS